MEWTISDLNKRVKNYNRIYFDNEIKLPIVVKLSRRIFNAGSDTYAYSVFNNDIHEIVISAKLLNASKEMLRSILVHELIHAWQDEHDPEFYVNYKELKGHGPAFLKKCEELNSKFKFRYPLERYVQDRGQKSVKRSSGGVYYVYKMTHSKVKLDLTYPIGVFVKLLYRDEIVHLVNKGLSVKFYDKAVYSDSFEWKPYRHTLVANTDLLVTYNSIKNCTANNFVQHITNEFSSYKIATDDDFNYQDGRNINL